MLRLLWGVLLGVVIGGAVAALAIKVLGITALGAIAAYGLAMLVGLLAGLLAGKPIWAKGARVEAGLKAFFGALISVGLMYALRTWATVEIPLESLGLVGGVLGQLPAVVLPLIGVVLSVVFEVDNLFGKSGEQEDKKRIAEGDGATKARIADGVEAEIEESSESVKRAKR